MSTNHVWCHGLQSSPTVQRPHIEAPQPTRRSYYWLRNTIHIQLHILPKSTFGDPSSSFHSFSPPDGWSDQESQLGSWAIPLAFHEPTSGWLVWLAGHSQVAYNNQVHASTCSSPFMLDTGQNPHFGIVPLRESHLEMLNDFPSWMEAETKEACSALTQAANDMACF